MASHAHTRSIWGLACGKKDTWNWGHFRAWNSTACWFMRRVRDIIQTVQCQVRSVRALFRLKPFDTSSANGRSNERLRRALLTSASAVTARVISMAGPLITVPLALGYLGHERYGLWMTVGAIVAMFTFADLGLGNGLMTEISQADGRGDPQEARRCVASALFALSGMSLILLCVYLLVFPFVPWPRVLNVSSGDLLRESGAVVTVCFVAFVVNLPLAVVQRVQWGLQEGFRTHLWQCAGSAINVVAVVASVKARASLPVLVFCVTGVQPLVNLLNGCVFFGIQRGHLRPRWQDFRWTTARRLLGTGFWFFLVSILLGLGIYSDNVVVAQVVGLKAVPLYAVPANLAAYLATVASMLYTPFWTANGEALARGDIGWVRSNAVRIAKVNALITGAAGLLFVTAGPVFLHWWIGPDFSPGMFLFAGMAAWAFLTSVMGPVFMILNGANAVRVQVLMFGVFSAIAVICKILLARQIGIAGVVWASVLPYACLVVPAALLAMNGVLRQAQQPLGSTIGTSQSPLATC